MQIQKDILEIIQNKTSVSSKEIYETLSNKSLATIKRYLFKLIERKLIISTGKGKATKYQLSPYYNLLYPINIGKYFEKEIDERKIYSNFNWSLLRDILPNSDLFTKEESDHLNHLQNTFKQNISKLSLTEYHKELERLAIDLSWKSSQIEGNTYSLLETERLLKEKEGVSGKTKEEALMLLNHKEAIDFIMKHPDYLYPLSIPKIEDIHSILTKGLKVDRNIRQRRVGISGTNFKPLDNEFQIKEALNEMCILINNKTNIFEKSLLALLLLSYIQAFTDGNKRTARIVSNAILINHNYCPISFRTVDSIDYKKAILIFYEQHNISAFKKIFIEQYEFAINTYF